MHVSDVSAATTGRRLLASSSTNSSSSSARRVQEQEVYPQPTYVEACQAGYAPVTMGVGRSCADLLDMYLMTPAEFAVANGATADPDGSYRSGMLRP